MSNPYLTSTIDPQNIFGRSTDFQALKNRLANNHVSVVGPKEIGKTFFLYKVAASASDHLKFDGHIYWDLKHNTPTTDDEFFRELRKLIRKDLVTIEPELCSLVDNGSDDHFSTVANVFDYLADCGKSVLLVLDGMDALMLEESITKNLWDNLRGLAYLSSVRFVTGSRRRLKELCRSVDSKTSDFWNVFPHAHSLKCLTSDDIEAFLDSFSKRGVEFDKGAKSELRNWSGGIPFILCLLLSKLWDEIDTASSVSADTINKCAESILFDIKVHTESLWDDCNEKEQTILAKIASGSNAEFQIQILEPLIARGLIVKHKNDSYKIACRFLEEIISEHGNDASLIEELFANEQAFEKNMLQALRHHLASIQDLDSDLVNQLNFLVEDLSRNDTRKFIQSTRGVFDKVFGLITEHEIPTRTISSTWNDHWRAVGSDTFVEIPVTRGDQAKLIRQMKDSQEKIDTKMTQELGLLILNLKHCSDYGQHLKHHRIQPSYQFCISVLASSIEIARQFAEVYRVQPTKISATAESKQ